MTTDEIVAFQAGEAAFAATPIGMTFNRFKSALVRAWVQDTEDSMPTGFAPTPTTSRR